MKKIILCVNLVCIVSMRGSEKKSAKIDINTVDQLRSELRNARKNVESKKNYDHVPVETKRNRNHSQQPTVENTK